MNVRFIWPCLVFVLITALTETVYAGVRLAFDARPASSISFVQINDVTNDAAVTEVRDGGKAGLRRPTGTMLRLGSGPNAGQSLQLAVNRLGLISRITAADHSRLDLRWNKVKGYREVQVILRDTRGRKIGFAESISPSGRSLRSATEAEPPSVFSFGESPETYYSWERAGLIKRDDLINNAVFTPEIGKSIAGMFDDIDRCVNTLIDRISKIPSLSNASGALGLKIGFLLGDAAAAASGLRDTASDYVGSLAGELHEYGKVPLGKLVAGAEHGADIVAAALSKPVLGTFIPTPPALGRARVDAPPSVVKEGETVTLRIVREGGSAGVLSGQIVVNSASLGSPDDFRYRGTAYYLFLDGDSSPKYVKLQFLIDRLAEGGELLTFEHDGGSGGLEQFAVTVNEAPPKKGSFRIHANRTGGGLGTATGCGFSDDVFMSGAAKIELSYDAQAGTGFAKASGSVGTSTGTFDYSWEGPVTWDGVAFSGSLLRVSNPARPPVQITVTRRSDGRYAATATLPFTVYLFNTNGSCTGPIQVFNFSVNNALMY